MAARSRGGLALLALLAFAPTALGAPTEQTVGLVISGGVSEGAYQAGATYAFMRFLLARRSQPSPQFLQDLTGKPPSATQTCGLASAAIPSLDVAAGSSAGNINAFLAGLTWCGQTSTPFHPRQNLFWDSWINVGWDGLSPQHTDEAAYVRQFDDPLSVGEYTTIAPHALRLWRPGTSVYSREDGLVTRSAFAVGFASLARGMEKGAFRAGCEVRIGLTATRTQPGTLKLGDHDVHAQRFVAPLLLSAAAPGASPAVTVENLALGAGKLAPAGLSLALPQLKPGDDDRKVDFASVVKLIKASSAFPLAFAPVALDHCSWGTQAKPRQVGGLACPSGMQGANARFMDGGIFDNQPFGLAEILAEDVREKQAATVKRNPAAPRKLPGQHTLFFIDVSPVRNPVTVPVPAKKKNGLTLLLDILGQRIDQVRGYENLGFARGHNDVQVRTSSRFFPIVANQLTASFGAFMHPSFRVYDYFIGVYDGIYWVAQSLDLGDECSRKNGDPDRPDQVLSSDRAPPTQKTFAAVAHLLVGEDLSLLRFVTNLFAYERYWTGNSGDGASESFCRLAPPDKTSPGPWREDMHVWQVFQAMCETDQEGRRLARQGATAALGQHLKEQANFDGLVRRLPPDFLGDVDEWSHSTADRLVRRAIDVEREDLRLGHENRMVETGALLGRFVLASLMERDLETVDLDPSSVARVSGGRFDLPRAFFHLLPGTLAWDPVQSRAMAGWEPKLRFGNKRLFVPFALLGEWYPYEQTFHPEPFGFTTHLGGIGWDPPERIVDDVGLAVLAAWNVPLASRARSYGIELAAHLAGSKFRLALGLPEFFAPAEGHHPGLFQRTRLDGFYVSVGLGDINGTFAWLYRSLAGHFNPARCEADCDGAPLPEVAQR